MQGSAPQEEEHDVRDGRVTEDTSHAAAWVSPRMAARPPPHPPLHPLPPSSPPPPPLQPLRLPFVILGAGTLLPWNTIITQSSFFRARFSRPPVLAVAFAVAGPAILAAIYSLGFFVGLGLYLRFRPRVTLPTSFAWPVGLTLLSLSLLVLLVPFEDWSGRTAALVAMVACLCSAPASAAMQVATLTLAGLLDRLAATHARGELAGGGRQGTQAGAGAGAGGERTARGETARHASDPGFPDRGGRSRSSEGSRHLSAAAAGAAPAAPAAPAPAPGLLTRAVAGQAWAGVVVAVAGLVEAIFDTQMGATAYFLLAALGAGLGFPAVGRIQSHPLAAVACLGQQDKSSLGTGTGTGTSTGTGTDVRSTARSSSFSAGSSSEPSRATLPAPGTNTVATSSSTLTRSGPGPHSSPDWTLDHFRSLTVVVAPEDDDSEPVPSPPSSSLRRLLSSPTLERAVALIVADVLFLDEEEDGAEAEDDEDDEDEDPIEVEVKEGEGGGGRGGGEEVDHDDEDKHDDDHDRPLPWAVGTGTAEALGSRKRHGLAPSTAGTTRGGGDATEEETDDGVDDVEAGLPPPITSDPAHEAVDTLLLPRPRPGPGPRPGPRPRPRRTRMLRTRLHGASWSYRTKYLIMRLLIPITSLFLIFFVTLLVFPSVVALLAPPSSSSSSSSWSTASTTSSRSSRSSITSTSSWARIYAALLFVAFNAGDLGGRLGLTPAIRDAVSPRLLTWTLGRIVLCGLVLGAGVQPADGWRWVVPAWVGPGWGPVGDVAVVVLLGVVGVSNGGLATVAVLDATEGVGVEDSDVAATMVSLAIAGGIGLGSVAGVGLATLLQQPVTT